MKAQNIMLETRNNHKFLYFYKRDTATAAKFRSRRSSRQHPLNSVHKTEVKPIDIVHVHMIMLSDYTKN